MEKKKKKLEKKKKNDFFFFLFTQGLEAAPFAAQMFGNAGREHMKLYNTSSDVFAKIAYKNHKHSSNNPYSQFRTVYTLEQIKESPKIFDPLTKLQCCPTSGNLHFIILFFFIKYFLFI